MRDRLGRPVVTQTLRGSPIEVEGRYRRPPRLPQRYGQARTRLPGVTADYVRPFLADGRLPPGVEGVGSPLPPPDLGPSRGRWSARLRLGGSWGASISYPRKPLGP